MSTLRRRLCAVAVLAGLLGLLAAGTLALATPSGAAGAPAASMAADDPYGGGQGQGQQGEEETCYGVGAQSNPTITGAGGDREEGEKIDCGDCATAPTESGACIPKWKKDRNELGQAPGFLSWIKLEDSRGTSVWNYELSIDEGGIRSPKKIIWSVFVKLWWGIYLSVVVLAIWFIDWVLTFGFLEVIAAPFVSIGDSLASVVDQVGVAPTFLTFAMAVAVIYMARGRWATGVWEMCVSVLIAVLATGMLSDPVREVASPDGLVMDTRAAAMEFATALANDGEPQTGESALRAHTTGMLVDILVRQPSQVINFGTVVDGTKCESDYNEVIDAGPYGDDDDIRDEVGDCDDSLGDYADNPNIGMAMSGWAVLPAGWTIAGFVLIFAMTVIGAVANACWQAVRSTVTCVTGVLPGARRGLFLTLAELVMSLVMIVFAFCFLVLSLMLVEAVMAEQSENKMPPMATFVIVDVVVLVTTVMFFRYKRRIKKSAKRFADRMERSRPGPGPSRMSGSGHSIWGSVAKTGITAYALHKMRGSGAGAGPEMPRAPMTGMPLSGSIPVTADPAGRAFRAWANQEVPDHRGLPARAPLELGGSEGKGPDSGAPGPQRPGPQRPKPQRPGPGDPPRRGNFPGPVQGQGSGVGGRRPSGRRRVSTAARVGVRAAAAYATGGTSSALRVAAGSAARAAGRNAAQRGTTRRTTNAGQTGQPAAPRTVRAQPMGPQAAQSHATQYRRVVRDGQVLYVPRD
jgi:hypothetical protein